MGGERQRRLELLREKKRVGFYDRLLFLLTSHFFCKCQWIFWNDQRVWWSELLWNCVGASLPLAVCLHCLSSTSLLLVIQRPSKFEKAL